MMEESVTRNHVCFAVHKSGLRVAIVEESIVQRYRLNHGGLSAGTVVSTRLITDARQDIDPQCDRDGSIFKVYTMNGAVHVVRTR